MVEKSVIKMKKAKAPSSSGTVTERLTVSSDVCSKMIADLKIFIIRDNAMPCNWNVSIIISLFKGKGEALYRLNYRDLNLTERILKVIKQIAEGFIRNVVKIDDMQFGFMPGRGTTDAIFIVRQVEEAYITKNRIYYLLLLIRKEPL